MIDMTVTGIKKIEGKKVITLSSSLQRWVAPSLKKGNGQMGVKLILKRPADNDVQYGRLYAIVLGIKVEIEQSNDCHCRFADFKEKSANLKACDKGGWADDTEAEGYNNIRHAEYDEVCKYLQTKYSIRERKFNALYELAEKGVPLLTKSEAKQLASANSSN